MVIEPGSACGSMYSPPCQVIALRFSPQPNRPPQPRRHLTSRPVGTNVAGACRSLQLGPSCVFGGAIGGDLWQDDFARCTGSFTQRSNNVNPVFFVTVSTPKQRHPTVSAANLVGPASGQLSGIFEAKLSLSTLAFGKVRLLQYVQRSNHQVCGHFVATGVVY
jgi:hypothetical protein